MKESNFFRQVKEEQAEQSVVQPEPLTASEHELAETKPMTIKDYWLTLRRSIQDKLPVEQPSPEEQERIQTLTQLISPELKGQYQSILAGFNARVAVSAEHPQREWVDINDEDTATAIENWIENLVQEVDNKRAAGLDENDMEELRAQCWLFFDALGRVMNNRSVEKDVAEYYQSKGETTLGQKDELLESLTSHYPLAKDEASILIDLVQAKDKPEERYSPRILVETINRLWTEYNLDKRRGSIAKISLGYLLAKAAESFAPSLFQNIIAQDKFNVVVFLEYFGLNKVSSLIDAKTEIELTKMMQEISEQINGRITNSLFFQEFEFIHEKSLGEIYEALERGKGATEQILRDTIAEFTPTLAGILMSLGFLTKINPALGAIGLCSLPIMYRMAKKQNEQVWPMYEQERREGAKISAKLGAIKSGFEEVKTSPEAPIIASHVKEQMDAQDRLSLKRSIEEIKMRLKRVIPFDAATVTAAGVGGALQEAGMISGGAVLSNIIYSNYLNAPIQTLVDLYFNRFSRSIQDVQRMDEILGRYAELDLPEGEKEKDRLPTTALSNWDIVIQDLRYKNILRGLNLQVKQGEWLTIAGASGAGKSTLLRNLVGLYKPDDGDIEIGGVRNDKLKKYGTESIYALMSYCNQNPQIFEGMTLRENLLLWSREPVSDEKIRQVLIDLHLTKFADKLDEEVKHLSGGERVRLGVARTLIKGAKIMLLDEPTASLDSQAASEVRKIIQEIHEKYPDNTIICVSHDEELSRLSSRAVNMADLQK